MGERWLCLNREANPHPLIVTEFRNIFELCPTGSFGLCRSWGRLSALFSVYFGDIELAFDCLALHGGFDVAGHVVRIEG